jgi:hypothetical protein
MSLQNGEEYSKQHNPPPLNTKIATHSIIASNIAVQFFDHRSSTTHTQNKIKIPGTGVVLSYIVGSLIGIVIGACGRWQNVPS